MAVSVNVTHKNWFKMYELSVPLWRRNIFSCFKYSFFPNFWQNFRSASFRPRWRRFSARKWWMFDKFPSLQYYTESNDIQEFNVFHSRSQADGCIKPLMCRPAMFVYVLQLHWFTISLTLTIRSSFRSVDLYFLFLLKFHAQLSQAGYSQIS